MDEPTFVRQSPLLEGAFALAHEAHTARSLEGTDPDHPVQVAEILHEHGFDDDVVAAALLHDVVEDTTTELDEIGERFGPDVRELVADMTEDPRIEPYERRKAEHRSRVSRDRRAAAIYAADKLAKTRGLPDDAEALPPPKLAHYRETLRLLRAEHPDLPFLGELEEELSRIHGPHDSGDNRSQPG